MIPSNRAYSSPTREILDENHTFNSSLSSSSASSDSYYSRIPRITMPSGVIIAVDAPPLLPNVVANKITPIMLADFDQGVRSYFAGRKKKEDETLWVKRIASSCYGCQPVYNWIRSQDESLLSKSFTQFMADMRRRFLGQYWHEELRRQMILKIMREDEEFVVWCEDLISINNCLIGTPSYFNEKDFITTIGVNICRSLYEQAWNKKLFDNTRYTTIGDWQRAISKLDDKRRDEKARMDAGVLAAHSCAANQPSRRDTGASYPKTSRPSPPSAPRALFPTWSYPYYPRHPTGPHKAVSARADSTYVPGSGPRPPPRLTEEERKILFENKGCTRCRRVQTRHQGRCTGGVPSGDGYQPVAYMVLENSSGGYGFRSGYGRTCGYTSRGIRSKRSVNTDREDRASKRSRAVYS